MKAKLWQHPLNVELLHAPEPKQKAQRRVRMEAGHRTAAAEIHPRDKKKLARTGSLMEVEFCSCESSPTVIGFMSSTSI
jgi:hypothetical protein